ILAIPSTGSTIPEEAPSKWCALQMAIQGTVAFWTEAVSDSCPFNVNLLTAPLGSMAAPTVLAKNVDNSIVAPGPGVVYWHDSNDLSGGFTRMTVPGGVKVNIPISIVTFASDATRLYFADASSGIYSVEHADPNAKITKLSSIPAYRIAADATNVYAADPC